MPLSAPAAHVAQLSALDLHKGIHGEKGFQRPETHALSGVTITVCRGIGDALADDKVAALRGAIYKVAQAGLALPNRMTLYTSSATTFMNVAFQRALDGTQNATVCLGGKLGTPASLPIGIATMVGGASILNFMTAVCVHELGHVLHEIADPEYFWSADANSAPPPNLCGQISMYASLNKKEYVAEVFTGVIYGKKADFGAAVMQKYTDYNGPTGVNFP